MDHGPETSPVTPQSRPNATPSAPPLTERAPQGAAAAFASLLVVAGPFWALVGRGQWFFQDEWAFLATRDAGNLGDLLRPHNEHWTTVPILAYRVLWNTVGANSYKPYQAMSIGMHLAAVVLLRAVMRRTGVSPWVATVVAGVFLFYGSGGDNVVWAFQITFIGAIAFGLGYLLLADDEAPGPRRVVASWMCGTTALMFSGVGLVMAAIVGLAVLLRRGWRAALRATAPLGVIYGAWYLSYGRDVPHLPGAGRRLILDFAGAGLRHAALAVGQHRVVVITLLALTACGTALAVWADRRSLADLRRHLAVPLAMAVGSVGFLVVTGVSRAGSFGTQFATISRYSYVVVALLAPLVAVAADAVIGRWGDAAIPVVLILVAGVPGNLRAVQVKRTDLVSPGRVLALANSPALTSAPRSEVPFPESTGARSITVGWLQDAVRMGRFPAYHDSPKEHVFALALLALEVGPDDPTLQRCVPLTKETTVHVAPERPVVYRGAVIVQVEGPDGVLSADRPVGTFQRKSLTSRGVSLTLHLRPTPNASPTLCR